MGRLSPDVVFLCGAGISARSGLPDGQALAAAAFDHVARDVGVYEPAALDRVRAALTWTAASEPALRLELLLELMSREIPVDVLAGVYSVVLGAAPTGPHYVVAASRRPIVTTNQDELIETAAADLGVRSPILHLHGVASDPATIMTTLGQYSAGLPASVFT